MTTTDAKAFRDWVANEATREEIERAKQSPMWMFLMYGGRGVEQQSVGIDPQTEMDRILMMYPSLLKWMDEVKK